MQQIALPDIEVSSLLTAQHRIFFAVLPPPALAREVARLSQDLRRDRTIGGQALDPTRLHVSLLNMGDRADFPTGVATAACTRASRLKLQQFTARFDRVSAFNGRSGTHAIVLRSSARSTTGFDQLHVDLSRSLRARSNPSFHPHMTLLYTQRRIPEFTINPISWTVTDFALVYSRINRGMLLPYIVLQRWQLGSK
jgi:2'-5' RNA ligase